MSESLAKLKLVAPSDAVCTDDGSWRSGWLAVLWEGENHGFADVNITPGQSSTITFTVFWLDEYQPMYRVDVDSAGKELTILKNFEGWLDDIGAIDYDDDGNAVNEDGECIDPEDVDPFQVVNGVVASDEDAAHIAASMLAPPFAVEEFFTQVMAVVGGLTAYTERWAHRYLRLSATDTGPAWNDLWRPVDIGPSGHGFSMTDARPGPVVRRVEAPGWRGYHLVEEAVTAVLDESGQADPPPSLAANLPNAYVGDPLSIDDVPDSVQSSWSRAWDAAHIAYEPNMS